jgi:hypothetical protein
MNPGEARLTGMSKKNLTPAQANRQLARAHGTGRYKKHNPCEYCGKSAGYNYFSHPCLDKWGGDGQVLCERCCDELEAMSDDDAYAALQRGRNETRRKR